MSEKSGAIDDNQLRLAMLRMMVYSFNPISYNYEWLTPQEKESLTLEEFQAIVSAIKAEGLDEKLKDLVEQP